MAKTLLFFLLLFPYYLSATVYSDTELKKLIGSLIMVGFPDENLTSGSEVVRWVREYDLGGVILFDRFYTDRSRVKNIRNPKQLRALTQALQAIDMRPLLIAVDQEGGRVARLKEAYGFASTPSAAQIGTENNPKIAKQRYQELARMLQDNGINCNFAPVVDLAVNPENSVIVGLERSYGRQPQRVAALASILIAEQQRAGVISVLKHFPGHGSSLGDSHKGFVDVTDTWSAKELEPYRFLIHKGVVDMIMTAHVFNRHWDAKLPATLSKRVNTNLLRKQLGYEGVIISDDMQMKAIAQHYSLKQTVKLAINAGVDMLLFGNQLAYNSADEVINTIVELVHAGEITVERLEESQKRLRKLHRTYGWL